MVDLPDGVRKAEQATRKIETRYSLTDKAIVNLMRISWRIEIPDNVRVYVEHGVERVYLDIEQPLFVEFHETTTGE